MIKPRSATRFFYRFTYKIQETDGFLNYFSFFFSVLLISLPFPLALLSSNISSQLLPRKKQKKKQKKQQKDKTKKQKEDQKKEENPNRVKIPSAGLNFISSVHRCAPSFWVFVFKTKSKRKLVSHFFISLHLSYISIASAHWIKFQGFLRVRGLKKS